MACLILYTDFRFYPMASLAKESFKYHHPDVDIFLVGPEQLPFFQKSLIRYVSGDSWGVGPLKYFLAQQIFSMGYNKVICLGADTATFARLDEFIEDDSAQIITSVDSNTPLYEVLQEVKNLENVPLLDGKPGNPLTPHILACSQVSNENLNEQEYVHLNADVVCFNDDVASIYPSDDGFPCRSEDILHPQKNPLSMFLTMLGVITKCYPSLALGYREQGLLNVLLLQGDQGQKLRKEFVTFNQLKAFEPDFSIEELHSIYDKWVKGDWRLTVVDSPYTASDVLYNIRSIYENDESLTKKEIDERVNSFYVKDGKVYNRDSKHIKVLHFRDSITQLSLDRLGGHINHWKECFPEDVVKLLRSQGCKNFFDTDWVQWYKTTMEQASKMLPHADDNFGFLGKLYLQKEKEVKERRDRGEEHFSVNKSKGEQDDYRPKD